MKWVMCLDNRLNDFFTTDAMCMVEEKLCVYRNGGDGTVLLHIFVVSINASSPYAHHTSMKHYASELMSSDSPAFKRHSTLS